MELDEFQKKAVEGAWNHVKNGVISKPFIVVGNAGTGKTTVIKFLIQLMNEKKKEGLVCSLTGRATNVIREKLDGVPVSDIGTIHSKFFRFNRKRRKFIPVSLSQIKGSFDFVVIDEISMVPLWLLEHVMSYGIPVIAFGDDAQLPPISGSSVFEKFGFDVKLPFIHRQNEGNLILELAMKIREGKDFHHLKRKFQTRRLSDFLVSSESDSFQFIVGKNETRRKLNRFFREKFGFSGLPKKGEKMMIRENNIDLGLMNGDVIVLDESMKRDDENPFVLHSNQVIDGRKMKLKFFHEEIDVEAEIKDHLFRGKSVISEKKKLDLEALKAHFGYVMTGHLSQGGEWDKVAIVDESFVFRDDSLKWLYTCVTRAKKELVIF